MTRESNRVNRPWKFSPATEAPDEDECFMWRALELFTAAKRQRWSTFPHVKIYFTSLCFSNDHASSPVCSQGSQCRPQLKSLQIDLELWFLSNWTLLNLFCAVRLDVTLKRFFKSELSSSGSKNGRPMRFTAVDFLDSFGHTE
jgi:hypothetical protein